MPTFYEGIKFSPSWYSCIQENKSIKYKRFSAEQIITVPKEAQLGISIKELCRAHGISEQTFCTWHSKCGGIKMSEALRLKALEEEDSTSYWPIGWGMIQKAS